MDPIHSDPRFSKLGKDRKFLSVSKKHKKVKIDKRFQSLFSNDKFVSKCTVDKRGRPKSLSSKESYEKFYDLEESDTSEDSDEPKDDDEDEGESEENTAINLPSVVDDPVIESDIKSKLLSSNIDYARGEADLYSDSSSEEDSDSEEEAGEEEEDAQFFDKWGELDGEAERTEDATDRLAVCNMDWDRVGADDIFLVLSSFCPAGGTVDSVQVFLSDFGKERLEEEKTLGPRELRQLRGEEGDEEDEEEEVTGVVDKKESLKREAAAMDRVRKYQVARLKYYYAVAKFDSIETANHVYTECDGMEYELSATRLDLRFIPAEMTFSTPSSSCMAPPNPEKYQPKAFCTTALQQGKVELTWDEDNQERAKAIKEAFNMEEGKEVDNLGDLIGSASEDEEDINENESDEEAFKEKGSISKYRALLAELGDKNENQPEEGDMEVTWKDEGSNEENEEMAPWDKYLKKKKDKKKKKIETLESGSDDPPEDVDMSDPFFAEELDERKQKKKQKKKKIKEFTTNDSEEGDDKLALMVMDSDDEKDHFNFKDIVESETKSSKSKKKWKKKKKQLEIPAEDSFDVNVSDSRFSALFSRPEFNIDPTDSNFKKTKNMEKIIEEKQKRIAQSDMVQVDGMSKKQKLDPEVSSSLKSVKNKWKKNAKKGKKTEKILKSSLVELPAVQ